MYVYYEIKYLCTLLSQTDSTVDYLDGDHRAQTDDFIDARADDLTSDHHTPVIDLTSTGEPEPDTGTHELTLAENNRLRHQTMTMFTWLNKRIVQLRVMIEYFDHPQNMHDTLRDFYSAHPELTIEKLVSSTCRISNVSTKTFYKWRQEFIKNGGKFERSQRGLAQFGWLLVNEDKKIELTHWIKSQKEISVRLAQDFINNTLLSEFPVGQVPEYGGLLRPTVPSTCHRWMLYCGCTYEPVRQSYLTESHQRHSTLLYRTWFCDLNYFLSLRMHRWCCFSKRSLAKLKDRFKDDWPDDILGHKIPIEDVGKFPPGIIILYL